MNILMFVMSLLMMLALLTYGRLDMYRSFVVTQGEFERYMASGERQAYNKGAEQWYNWTALSSKNGEKQKKPAPKDSSSKLPISWLFQPQYQQTNPQAYQTSRDLLKKLMHVLFNGQTDFKNALENNPQVIDDLINAMQAAGNKLSEEKKPLKSTEGLENLDLENPLLQDLYYRMIKGYSIALSKETKKADGDQEEADDQQSEEYIHKEGTLSLLDFVTLNPSKTKIRVFLAPQSLLLTIFDDPMTVHNIMQVRLELYHQAKGQEDYASLSEQFKQGFISKIQQVPETMLDFSVTSTDPRNYEVQ